MSRIARKPADPPNRYTRVVLGAGESARQHWKLMLAAAAMLGVVLYAFDFIAGDEGLLKMRALKKETATLTAQNADLRRQKTELAAQSKTLKLQNLQANPYLLEKLVRENRLLVRPGEILYTFDETGTAAIPTGLPEVTVAQRPPKKPKTDATD